MKCLLLVIVLGATLFVSNAEVSAPADIAVLLDSTQTIKAKRWHYMTEFFNGIARGVDYGPEKTRLAAIRLSTYPKEMISLGQYDTVEKLTAAMDAVPFKSGSNRMDRALNKLVDETLSKENSRPGVERIAVVVMDDRSRKPSLTEAALKRCKDDGIKFVVVGLQHNRWFDRDELLKIAGDESRLIILKRLPELIKQETLDKALGVIAEVAKPMCTDGDEWTAPSGWKGPEAAYYKSFDNTKCMTLHNGAELVDGNNGQALRTNLTLQQYVDLGMIGDQACLVTPSTCTSAGASFSGWYKSPDPKQWLITSLVSSRDQPTDETYSQGFFLAAHIYTNGGYVVPAMMRQYMTRDRPDLKNWFHIALVFINENVDVQIYIDGAPTKKLRSNVITNKERVTNRGHVVIGQTYTNQQNVYGYHYYQTVMADDIVFFNKALTADEVKMLYEANKPARPVKAEKES